jgi:Cu2+-exporting ATPase
MALIQAEPLPDLRAFVRRIDGEEQLELLVQGARCAGCLSKIENLTRSLPGVLRARMNLTTGKLVVGFKPGSANPSRVIQALEALGYPAKPFSTDAGQADQDREGRELLLALGVAGFGVGNVMMFSVPVWAGLFGQELAPGVRTFMIWWSAIVGTPCALYAGLPFFRSAWRSLRHGRANMDVPITIGVLLTLAVSFSEAIQRGSHAYFDAAVSLLFLLLIGRYLDHRLRLRARSAAADLLALQAPVAVRIGSDGVERGVPVEQVAVGDRLAVAPGDRIPVDGIVESGRSELDNALISGETTPFAVRDGARVHAGALNLSGRLIIAVEARAADSTVAAIARLMEAGAQSKSKYVRWADKAATLYVPIVHTLAAVTFVGVDFLGLGYHEAFLRAAAVLIITCPCALGLAVPAVQITASGRLFRKGVLVKSGAALERLAEVDHVVFDKTGVLTEGRPRLVGAPDPAVLACAAKLARASRHPLAVALAAAAPEAHGTAKNVVEIAGLGLKGEIDGRVARLGRAAFIGVTDQTGDTSELWFQIGDQPPLRFAFQDVLRPDAAQAVAALKARGIAVEILSGDVPAVVREQAQAVGIETWRASLTPLDKAGAIERLGQDHNVLMVGDGLNDAAALARAHVSIAPSAAVDASQNAADLVFSNGRLDSVVLAIDVARTAKRRAMENFGLSALYNLIAAPAAMLGLINPFIAAIAMSASSLAVMLNALRMNVAGARK